jgi:hypothetical protein
MRWINKLLSMKCGLKKRHRSDVYMWEYERGKEKAM